MQIALGNWLQPLERVQTGVTPVSVVPSHLVLHCAACWLSGREHSSSPRCPAGTGRTLQDTNPQARRLARTCSCLWQRFCSGEEHHNCLRELGTGVCFWPAEYNCVTPLGDHPEHRCDVPFLSYQQGQHQFATLCCKHHLSLHAHQPRLSPSGLLVLCSSTKRSDSLGLSAALQA